MISDISHTLREKRRRRLYPGENHSYLLVRWLNHTHDEPRARVTTLIEAGKDLSASSFQGELPTLGLNPYRPGLIGSKAAFANSKRSERLIGRVNRLLSAFKLFPRYERTVRSSWRVSWIHTTNRNRLYIRINAGGNDDDIPFGEGDAVSSVLRLAELGRLNQLRECACGKWFYARFSHQQFCKTSCQQKRFRGTEQYRAHRRQYMRKYRLILAKLSRRPFKARTAKRPATNQH
jgi:hypothetical protein